MPYSPIDQAVAGVRLGSEPGLLLACVSSGSEALEAVFGGKWLPDLVLMDVALHDAPASEVCAAGCAASLGLFCMLHMDSCLTWC